MAAVEQLVTENLDIWASAVQVKSAAGRGSANKLELYGIKKLRELTLELAVRGLLVPQDPDDEPASELLKKIAAEKAQLVKEGKIKKQRELASINEDEKDFELPQGWQYVRLGSLFNSIESGGTPSKRNADYWGGDIPWASVKDLGTKRYISDTQDHITEKGLNNGSRLAKPGDLLVCTRMGLGKVAIVQESMAYNQDLKGISLSSKCNVEFFLNAYATLKIKGTGTTVAGIKQEQLLGFILGLPPLPEQARIVAKVDELMALCDQLEQQQEASITAHQTLVKTLLDALATASERDGFTAAWARIADHFDTLFTTEWSIDQLKQTILRLAVMGKLVPQDPNDQPASVLLEEIDEKREGLLAAGYPNDAESKTQLKKQNKQKLPNKLPTLPSGWAWTTLQKSSLLIVDCHNKTAPYEESGIALLRTSNIRDGILIYEDLRYVSEKTFMRWAARAVPEAGDLLITREAPMGETCIVPDDQQYCMGQRMMLIRMVPGTISPSFMLISLRDPNLMERVQDKPVGMTVQHLRVGGVETLLVPVPPRAEQDRIVAKVDELMPLCETLKTLRNTAKATQLQLADVMASDALT